MLNFTVDSRFIQDVSTLTGLSWRHMQPSSTFLCMRYNRSCSAGDGREAWFQTDGGFKRGFELATLTTLQQAPHLSVSHSSPSCPWHALLSNGQKISADNQNLNSSSAVSVGTSVECEHRQPSRPLEASVTTKIYSSAGVGFWLDVDQACCNTCRVLQRRGQTEAQLS